jgi:hypothetical protein
MMTTAAIEAAVEWPNIEKRICYDGHEFILRPRSEISAQTISVECPEHSNLQDGMLLINRFISAYAWAERRSIRITGAMGNGKNEPMDLCAITDLGRHTGEFRFDYRPVVAESRAKLALAIYREAIYVNSVPYQFLGFAKILNIIASGDQLIKWINNNVNQVHGVLARQRLTELKETHPDIGKYLYVDGRCAIAHALGDPLVDPDLPDVEHRLWKDVPLMQALAERLIETELGVKTRKTWLLEPHSPFPE